MQYSVEQKIIPRAFTVDELFDDVTRKLASSATGLRCKLARLAQHRCDRRTASCPDLAENLEAVPLVERAVLRVARFEIGRRPLGRRHSSPASARSIAAPIPRPLRRGIDAVRTADTNAAPADGRGPSHRSPQAVVRAAYLASRSNPRWRASRAPPSSGPTLGASHKIAPRTVGRHECGAVSRTRRRRAPARTSGSCARRRSRPETASGSADRPRRRASACRSRCAASEGPAEMTSGRAARSSGGLRASS